MLLAMHGDRSAPFGTNSGMLCVWNQSAFATVCDYDSWEPELCEDEDIIRHIEAGHFVPINIGSDGVFEVELRIGSAAATAALSDRELKFLVVKSQPYLFRSQGNLHLSGIECVNGEPDCQSASSISLLPGDWEATIYLVSWDDEPGAKNADGSPAAHALPDFVSVQSDIARTDLSNESPVVRAGMTRIPIAEVYRRSVSWTSTFMRIGF